MKLSGTAIRVPAPQSVASMDGNTARIFAQRLDPNSKRPQGSPIPVYQFPRQTSAGPPPPEFTIARDKLVHLVTDATSSVWMTEVP